MTPRQYLVLARKSLAAFVADHSLRMSAALSYYTLLSMAPLILIILSAADLWWDRPQAAAAMIGELDRLLGPAAADVGRTILENAQEAGVGLGAGIIGLATTLFGATVVFLSLQDSVNVIWRVEPRKGRRLWSFIRKRLFSLVMVLAVGVLLLASVLLTTAITGLQAIMPYDWIQRLHLWQMINLVVSALIISFLFGAIFRYLPDVKLRWADVILGAVVTGVLFSLGKHLLSLYFSQWDLGKAYGAAGSIVVFLVWIYYSSVIMLAGAELTRIHTLMRRPNVEPADHAAWSPHHLSETPRDAQSRTSRASL